MQVKEQRKFTRYLLGDLPNEERIEIEDRYLSDGDFFDELLVAEDELIDDYVRGKLPKGDRQLFEQNFLFSSARQERLKSARTLMKFADMHASPDQARKASLPERVRLLLGFGSTAMRLVLVTGMVALIIGIPLVLVQLNRFRSELINVQAQQQATNQRERELQELLAQQRQQNERLDQEIDRERSERGHLEQELAKLKEQQAAQASPITYSLGLGEIERSRGGPSTNVPKLTIAKGADYIKLRLDLLKANYENYLVVLRDEQGREVWRGFVQSAKAAKGYAVTVRLPSRLFITGRYELELQGTNNNQDYETVSLYTFEILKR